MAKRWSRAWFRAGMLAAGMGLCLGTGPGTAAWAKCRLTLKASIPMESAYDEFLLDVTVNGKPVRLILDTGAGRTVLSFAALRRVGATRVDEYGAQASGIGGYTRSDSARLDDLGLGMLHAKNVYVAAGELGRMSNAVDGLFGMDFLYTYDVDIDTLGHRLNLYTDNGACSQPTATLAAQPSAIKLLPTGVEEGRIASGFSLRSLPDLQLSPRILVTIGGRQFKAMLDSGAAASAMFRDTASGLGVLPDMSKVVSKVFGTGPNTVAAAKVALPEMDVGDLTLTDVPIDVMDQASMGGTSLLLGNDFMRSVHVWISHSSGYAILEYPPSRSPLP